MQQIFAAWIIKYLASFPKACVEIFIYDYYYYYLKVQDSNAYLLNYLPKLIVKVTFGAKVKSYKSLNTI